jgi:hypothetical protein
MDIEGAPLQFRERRSKVDRCPSRDASSTFSHWHKSDGAEKLPRQEVGRESKHDEHLFIVLWMTVGAARSLWSERRTDKFPTWRYLLPLNLCDPETSEASVSCRQWSHLVESEDGR